jgi:hypothetical protein
MSRHDAVRQDREARFGEIVGLVDPVCRRHLTEEYAAVVLVRL